MRIAHLVTHPIQYFVPLYRKIAELRAFDLTVFYENDLSLGTYADPGFGRPIAWGMDLLGGYDHHFLPRWGPSHRNGRLFPINWGLWEALRTGRFDAVWINGYTRLGHLSAILQARALGLPVALRGDTNHFQAGRGVAKEAARSVFLRGLHASVQGFLSVGQANRAHYLAHGAPEGRIFNVPFSVDHERLNRIWRERQPEIPALRATLDLEPGRPILAFVGRLAPEKGVLDLVEGYRRLAAASTDSLRLPHLLLVGDGPQRAELEDQLRENPLPYLRLAGFQNQMDLPLYYGLCDALILPSRFEPWGLVVNEAMALGKPVLASDQVGAALDLVEEGKTGWRFPAGDSDAISNAIQRAFRDLNHLNFLGQQALARIQYFSLDSSAWALRSAFESMTGMV